VWHGLYEPEIGVASVGCRTATDDRRERARDALALGQD